MYTKQDCIDSLKEAADALGNPLGSKEYRESDFSPSVKTIENKFGSWNEGKEAAGLTTLDHGVTVKGRFGPPAPSMQSEGYIQYSSRYQGETDHLKIHRLIAVAEYGFDEVCGNVVHHKNNIPWDNRPGNLEVMTVEDHSSLHNTGIDVSHRERDSEGRFV